jgi:hypothetical protein
MKMTKSEKVGEREGEREMIGKYNSEAFLPLSLLSSLNF